ncbi:type VI secretion system baseplate subunit TssF [Rahnella sp. PCH160]|uniref:type VI secretion system baseplate subunit TssF n=1 Tax=Rahnella sp. PCH160 TaxID=3447928 RepID=UPI0039FCF5F0
MNNEERYYREELDYLRQLAKMLAKENPHLTSFLESKDSEPDIERVFEAFSILSGHVRTRIEDSFPEITHPMLNTLWPSYLRPLPSMAIIEFSPAVDEITTPTRVTKGMVLQSAPINLAENTPSDASKPPCKFTLSRDVWLMPLHIDTVVTNSSLQSGMLDINISISRLANLNDLDLNKLRFWLSDEDKYTRYQLYLWLSQNLTDIELLSGGYNLPQPDMLIKPIGFETLDMLLPYPEHSSCGFKVLQEYLCYQDSFMFFDITGFRKIPVNFFTDEITFRFHFNKPFPADLNVKNNTFRLHCSPSVNIFPHESEKIRRNEESKSYPLLASQRYPEYYDIFSVTQVRNKIRSGNKQKGKSAKRQEQVYKSLESSPSCGESAKGTESIYYHIQRNTSMLHNRFDHNISFSHADGRPAAIPKTGNKKEDIITSLSCTNREVPEFLEKGDINRCTEVNPAIASFTNITKPTQPLPPLTDAEQHWSLLSSMNLSYLTLLDTEAIKQVLRDFDIPGISHPNLSVLSEQKLDAIEKIDTRPVDRLFKGVPVRGITSIIYLHQEPFLCEGEMYLLCTVLSYVFALYSSENSFHILKMVNIDTEECYEWEARRGQHKLM